MNMHLLTKVECSYHRSYSIELTQFFFNRYQNDVIQCTFHAAVTLTADVAASCI